MKNLKSARHLSRLKLKETGVVATKNIQNGTKQRNKNHRIMNCNKPFYSKNFNSHTKAQRIFRTYCNIIFIDDLQVAMPKGHFFLCKLVFAQDSKMGTIQK